LESVPEEIKSKIAKAIIKPEFYFAADLYKEGKNNSWRILRDFRLVFG